MRLIIVFFLAIFGIQSFTQTPEKMSYQAVVRDINANLIINQSIRLRISILQGSVNGTSVYSETHVAETNANGLVSTEVGGGDPFLGSINNIDWANGPFFIRTEIDPTGGTNYTISGTSQLLSVPYALYSKNSGSSIPGPPGPQGPPGLPGPQGLTGPPGNSPVVTSVKGTNSLIANNSVLNYTLIPGLTTNITVPSGTTNKVLIQADGSIQLNSASSSGVGFVDVAIFVNGVQEGAGRRIPVLNSPSVTYSVSSYSFSTLTTLPAGQYTVQVRAKKFSTLFDDCFVSSSSSGSVLAGNPPLQGVLNIMQFQ